MVDEYSGNRRGRYEPEKWPLPVVAYYTPAQAVQFADYYNAQAAESMRAMNIRSKESTIRQAEATRRLRNTPKIGDRTSLGVIIDLRPPLAHVQYDAEIRTTWGKPPSEWMAIDSLDAPRF